MEDEMAEYMTEQRRKLLDFLHSHPDKLFSAKDIARNLSDRDISVSAVYRNLAWLERAGVISRTVKDGRREIYYSCVGADCCREKIHLTCMKCGDTFHMDSEVSERILRDVAGVDGFRIDKCKTVLYGVCKHCD